MSNSKFKIFYFLFFSFLIFLSFNKHSKDKANSYHDVIWADAAGYYVYQPMWYIYGSNASAFPDSIDIKTGEGFRLNHQNNTIQTKYTCGIAILQTPFFLAAHILAKPFGFDNNGFSKIYSFAIYFAGVFYCCCALLLLSKFLTNHFSNKIAILAPILLLASTNLFYYTIDAPSMSHIYSFFLFSLIIYLSPIIISNPKFIYFLIFFSALTLIVLIRPTNFIIGLFPFFYLINNKSDFYIRFKKLINNKATIVTSIILSFLIAIPQLLYWQKISGKLLFYSYTNESFIYWNKPKLLEVWFSTNNGLFLYSPIILLSIIGVFIVFKIQKWFLSFILIIFIAVSYICASWWNWWFGCSFGARSFIEYYALLIIPACYLIQYIFNNKNLFIKAAIVTFILFCIYLNMDIEYYYDGCFYGNTWDFVSYFNLLNS